MKNQFYNALAKSDYIKVLYVIAVLLLFLELIGFLNRQWLTVPMAWPYPYDVMVDLQEGLYVQTLLSTFIATMMGGLLYAWYRGAMSRVVTNVIACLIAGVLWALITTTLIFNAWVHIHITTVGQLISIFSSLYQHTHPYHRFLFAAFIGMTLPMVGLIAWLYEYIRQDNKVLGDAHFASGFEINRAGFFKTEKESIIIGKKYGAPIYTNGFEHVLVFAPSGSGKTRSISLPNLFNYPYSVVCNDVKFTLFETTSGFRQTILGHECYCFAPARHTGKTHRYNPLSFITSDKNQRITDIQRMAHIFIPDQAKDPFWSQTSRKLFKALVLYLLDTPERPTTFGEINRLIKQQNFDAWINDTLDNTEHYDPEFYRNGYSYINNDDRTRANILESFSGYFELFDDPIIDAATSASDFDFSQLRQKKMTIYVGFTDEDMERIAPLLTLFWQQLISSMIKDIPDPIKEPYPLLCLIDEFSSLGRIDRLRRSLKLLREYRVRCILMFQYIAQTYEKYSHDEARAFTNIKTKVAYTTEDLNDAEFISKMLGTRTKRIVTYSSSSQSQGAGRSKNVAYQAIPLLRPEDVMKMPAHITLILRAGFSPVKAQQWIWYKERSMKHLPCGASALPTQTIKHHPFARTAVHEKEKHHHEFEQMED